jgi:hypothetical protein
MLEELLTEIKTMRIALQNLDESYKQIAAVNAAGLAFNSVMFAWQATGRKELTETEFNDLTAEAMKNMGVFGFVHAPQGTPGGVEINAGHLVDAIAELDKGIAGLRAGGKR